MSKNPKVTEIEELVIQLKNKCKAAKLPMFIAICTSSPDEDTMTNTELNEIKSPNYLTDFVTPYNCNLKLSPDYIADGIKAINGFGDIKRKDVLDLDELDFRVPESFKN